MPMRYIGCCRLKLTQVFARREADKSHVFTNAATYVLIRSRVFYFFFAGAFTAGASISSDSSTGSSKWISFSTLRF